MIQKISTWTERFGLTNQKKQTEKSLIPWVANFSQFLDFINKECSVKPEVNVIYKRHAGLPSTLTKFKTLAHKHQNALKFGSSTPCGNCALCGNFARYECMVRGVNHIRCKKSNRLI